MNFNIHAEKLHPCFPLTYINKDIYVAIHIVFVRSTFRVRM